MTKILHYYIPDRQLDLPTLKSLAAELFEKRPEDYEQPPLGQLESPPDLVSPIYDHNDVNSSQDGPIIEEIGILHEQLGCLMIDSRGKYSKSTS